MSSETLLFTAPWRRGRRQVERRLVARIEPPATDYPVFTTYDLDMQFRVMRLVRARPTVPVPETFWYEPDPTVLGGAFFVMDRVDGLVPPDVLPYTFGDNWVFDGTDADRRAIQESAVEALAGIHAVTPDRHDLGVPAARPDRRHRARTQPRPLAGLPRVGGAGPPSPLLADCFAWLTDNLPTDVSADALSWGDGRIGNMMFRDNEVVAVLDWEMAGGGPARGGPGVDVLPPPVLPGPGRRPGGAGAARHVPAGGRGRLLCRGIRPAPRATSPGTSPIAAMRHGAIMRRVTERSIYFGEAEAPDDIDELIMHRATLRGILDGTYWAAWPSDRPGGSRSGSPERGVRAQAPAGVDPR